MKVEYKEIFNLKVMLDKANIPYKFLDRSYIYYDEQRLQYPFYQIIVYEQYNDWNEWEDLLEIQGCLTPRELKEDSVKGYLTAKEVFKRIKKNYIKEWSK